MSIEMVKLFWEYVKPSDKVKERPVIDPLPIVQRAVAMYKRVVTEAPIDYRGPDHLPSIRMAPVELSQVLLNLISNATQAVLARGERRGIVEVGARPQGDMLELSIRDEGVGMPPDVLKRVGTPWFTTRAEGTGLGVANCQRLIGSVGGRLRIESEQGVGTTVTILLPTAA
jgi:signal transduction histidine kinase